MATRRFLGGAWAMVHGPADAVRLWTWVLDHGFAVLLFDKRGVHRSGGNWKESNFSDRAVAARASGPGECCRARAQSALIPSRGENDPSLACTPASHFEPFSIAAWMSTGPRWCDWGLETGRVPAALP